MPRLLRLAACLAALAFAVAGCAQPVPVAQVVTPVPPPLRILALGDSLTIGHGSTDGAGYRTELGRQLTAAGVTFTWVGGSGFRNGWTVQDLRAGIDNWMAADTPDVVLLNIGTNNAAGVGPGMAGFESAYLDLVRRIIILSPTVHVWVAMVPYSVAAWARNEVDVNVAAIHSTWYYPRTHLVDLSVLPPCLLWDGVHPADLGYDVLGRQWFRALAAHYGLPGIPPDPLRGSARRPGFERAPTDGSC